MRDGEEGWSQYDEVMERRGGVNHEGWGGGVESVMRDGEEGWSQYHEGWGGGVE